MKIEECQELITSKKLFVLGVKQADIKFGSRNEYLTYINFDVNKTTEMAINGLLSNLKFNNYESVVLIHDKKIVMLPIVKGSFRFSETNKRIMRCRIEHGYKVKRNDLVNWHLDEEKEKKLDKKIMIRYLNS